MIHAAFSDSKEFNDVQLHNTLKSFANVEHFCIILLSEAEKYC